jgi:equilibrative nucleoside transporter 1/2/3
MDRARRLFEPRGVYQPIDSSETDAVESQTRRSQPPSASHFSRVEYGVFFLLGVSMLWAWYEPPTFLRLRSFSF